jgi:hypothetical protein
VGGRHRDRLSAVPGEHVRSGRIGTHIPPDLNVQTSSGKSGLETQMRIEDRRAVLQQAIAHYTQSGYRVVSQTDTTAQLVKPRVFSCLWSVLWFLCFGIGLVLYILYYLSKRDAVIFVSVDENGRVTESWAA